LLLFRVNNISKLEAETMSMLVSNLLPELWENTDQIIPTRYAKVHLVEDYLLNLKIAERQVQP
jgi:hypothetical protein